MKRITFKNINNRWKKIQKLGTTCAENTQSKGILEDINL